jgi:glycosyltransferase involved in cell wall biosynthesis
MSGHPLVSVVVPAYNAEAFLGEALDSILRQEYEPLEIIVVDDGSQDATAGVVAAFGDRVRYFYQENRGAPAARNRGLDLARGSLVAFLDADDWWSDRKLELQFKHLRADPSLGIVLGHTQEVRYSETVDGIERFVPLRPAQPMLSMGSALIRKAVFARVGLFDETLLFCDDIDWFLRARENAISIRILPEITQYYRKHSRSITANRELEMKYRLAAFKKSIDRRRRQAADGNKIPLKKWSDFLVTDE